MYTSPGHSYIDLPFKYNWTPGRNGAIKNEGGPLKEKEINKNVGWGKKEKVLFGVVYALI